IYETRRPRLTPVGQSNPNRTVLRTLLQRANCVMSIMRKSPSLILFALLLISTRGHECAGETLPHFRTVSGYILTQQNERLPGVTVILEGFAWDARTISDREGYFRVDVPVGNLKIRLEGKNIQPLERTIARSEPSENLEFKVNVIIAPLQESVV